MFTLSCQQMSDRLTQSVCSLLMKKATQQLYVMPHHMALILFEVAIKKEIGTTLVALVIGLTGNYLSLAQQLFQLIFKVGLVSAEGSQYNVLYYHSIEIRTGIRI